MTIFSRILIGSATLCISCCHSITKSVWTKRLLSYSISEIIENILINCTVGTVSIWPSKSFRQTLSQKKCEINGLYTRNLRSLKYPKPHSVRFWAPGQFSEIFGHLTIYDVTSGDILVFQDLVYSSDTKEMRPIY